jgi:predicted nucleic acid-binding protein
VGEAIAADRAAVCGLVAVEVLSFVSDDDQYRAVSEDFSAYHRLPTGEAEYAAAVTLGRAMRAHGVTIPATDLVIAATAINHRALLLHADRHFERIAELGELRQSNPAGA